MPHSDAADPGARFALGTVTLARALEVDDLEMLHHAALLLQNAVDITPTDSPELHRRVTGLSFALFAFGSRALRRALRYDDLEMLDHAVSALQAAVDITPADSSELHGRLGVLTLALSTRFERNPRATDEDQLIKVYERALTAIPRDHPDWLKTLANLGSMLGTRFEHTRDLSDSKMAINALKKAVAATPQDHPNRAARVDNLIRALQDRYQHTHRKADLDALIEVLKKDLAATPKKNTERHTRVSQLGGWLRVRFDRTQNLNELNRAIKALEEAVNTVPKDHANLHDLLYLLGSWLRMRFERTKRAADLNQAIKRTEQAIAATPRSDPQWAGRLSDLAALIMLQFERTGRTSDLDRAIQLLRRAKKATPEDHPERANMLYELGATMAMRSERTGSTADLNRAIKLLEKAVNSASEGHSERAASLSYLGAALATRFERTGSTPDLNRAIVFLEQAAIMPTDHPNRAGRLSNLGVALRMRYQQGRHEDSAGDLDRAIELFDQAVAATPKGDAMRPGRLSNLGVALRIRYSSQTGNLDDLNRAIKVLRRANKAIPEKHYDRPGSLSNLAAALLTRSVHKGTSDDIARAISVGEAALATTPADHPALVGVLTNLGSAVLARFELSKQGADSERALRMYRQAAGTAAGPLAERAGAAWKWGRLAVIMKRWDDAVDGFVAAVELAGLAAPWELTRADQESRLSSFTALGSEAAAACLQAGKPSRAVELFEQGRAVMFSQVLDARSDLTDLWAAEPKLARRFVRWRNALDKPDLGRAAPPISDFDPATAGGLDAEARRVAWANFTKVVSEIQRLNGFERFLAPRSLTELRVGAAYGPIVFLNISVLRSDALIITDESDDVKVVPLPAATPEIILGQANMFLRALSQIHDRATSMPLRAAAIRDLEWILSWLGDHITSPVLEHLGYSCQAEAGTKWPRIWWCPAGVLTLLPIHAAGRHALSDSDAVIDRVISSTIPNVGALIRAREAVPITAEPQVLVVAMPTTPGEDDLLGAAAEAAMLQELWSPRVTTLGLTTTNPATYDAVTAALPQHDWAHFACHGHIDVTNPSASHLLLADGAFSVIDLIHTRLTRAELAFLSACTTARTGTELLDEPIHLAAACQLAGYRHVIASLWPIADDQTAELSKCFYNAVKDQTTRQRTDAAAALHHATRELRASNRLQPNLWAPFLHTGP